ncbi:DUF6082 family protein [Winogradskya humida]|uniref:DUF4760 domain-containing protein n=1 Tax=Winogradskya humida TaxID=113566 RepID=A0ABQ3ZLN3_9ACTN|nr:DUF6082 family protein [Actinoplanes humidus]GIE19409.1 hypothetical protein Ahu01nite_025110 [Actinoplanes humidus]
MKVRLERRQRLRLVSTIAGLTIGTGVVLWSPMIFYRILGRAMPWQDLADVGQAYGGASALLSAAALCGIGFSLILQSRQLRQELTSLDKQRHFELIKLALDNPEFFEVIDIGQVTGPRDRLKVYANLMMNYWLAMWELGEIGEAELRNLTRNLFKGDLARTWWQQQQGTWMTVRTRRRRRFIAIADEEWTAANTTASQRAEQRPELPRGETTRQQPGRKRRRAAFSLALLGAGAAAHVYRRRARRGRSTHRP